MQEVNSFLLTNATINDEDIINQKLHVPKNIVIKIYGAKTVVNTKINWW